MRSAPLVSVELPTDLPGEDIRCGHSGAVVHVSPHRHEADEVEFVEMEKDGKTVAMLPLLRGQLALHFRARSSRVAANEVACKREPDDRPAVGRGHVQRRL